MARCVHYVPIYSHAMWIVFCLYYTPGLYVVPHLYTQTTSVTLEPCFGTVRVDCRFSIKKSAWSRQRGWRGQQLEDLPNEGPEIIER